MKNVVVFIFIALITLINTNADFIFSTPAESTCVEGLAKATLEATVQSTSSVSFTFNITLVDSESYEYKAACIVDYERRDEIRRRILNYNKRKLESTQVNCEFNQPEEETTLTYKKNSIFITDESTGNNITFDNNFSVSYKCGATQDSTLSDKESDVLSDNIDKSGLSDNSNSDVASGKADETSTPIDEASGSGKADEEIPMSDVEDGKADETSTPIDVASGSGKADETSTPIDEASGSGKADETSTPIDEASGSGKASDASTDAPIEKEIVTPNTTISSDTDTEKSEELEEARKRLNI